eukprot:2387575-Alexandrium_andersonii.AAC.1
MTIGGRWVDHQKGDAGVLNICNRCVAKDVAFWKGDAVFAATPPPTGCASAHVRLGDPRPRRRMPAATGGEQGAP